MINRKTAVKLLLVQWSRFQNTCISLSGSTLITGINGSGKSTVLDAITYLLTGNTQFNKAAKDRDRNVLSYVRGETKSEGSARFLRHGAVISYIAMEFESENDENLTVAVCLESSSETDYKSSWFIARSCGIGNINFAKSENGKLIVTPKYQLVINGKGLKSSDFMGRDKGTEQILRALGLRCSVDKYRNKLLKMMAFNPENNIDKFISDCVLEPGKMNSLQELREQKTHFDEIKKLYDGLKAGKEQLDRVEELAAEYEERKQHLTAREIMLIYQNLCSVRAQKNKFEETRVYYLRRIKELKKSEAEALQQLEKSRKRLQAAESNTDYLDMKASIAELESQLNQCIKDIEVKRAEIERLSKLQEIFKGRLSWLLDQSMLDGEGRNYLREIIKSAHGSNGSENCLRSFLTLAAEAGSQKEKLEEDRVHSKDNIIKLKSELNELEGEYAQLMANRMVFPKETVNAVEIIREEFRKKNIKGEVKIFAELVSAVKDESWQRAIECFLGRKRFNIIVDGPACLAAMRILKERNIYGANVVITDKLPESREEAGSAAEQLEINNVYARRYANYLLNGIHLCESVDELHEYPRGGLTKDGMLAKSYAVSLMEIKKVRFCLGQRAIELQKKNIEAAIKNTKKETEAIDAELKEINARLQDIASVRWDGEDYSFEAPSRLSALRAEEEKLSGAIEKISADSSYLGILTEQQEAKKLIPRNRPPWGLFRKKPVQRKIMCARQRQALKIWRKVHTLLKPNMLMP